MLHNSNLDTKTKIEYLNQLEYDMLYGKNYTSEYEKLIPSSEYRVGFKDVKIDSVENYNENNILIGALNIGVSVENFNNYSSIYIDGKPVEKTFIDSNTLAITKDICKPNSIVQVCQPSATGSTIFSYSNEVIFK